MHWTLSRLVLSTALVSKPRVGAFRVVPLPFLQEQCSSCHASRRELTTVSALRGGADANPSSLPQTAIPASFTKERQDDVNTAVLAVLASCRVTRRLQPNTGSSIATIAKQDASPVTIGDFASQATALKIIHSQFPSDMFIAEEGSDVLRSDDQLLTKVWDAVKLASSDIESICSWSDKEEVLRCIDYGQGIDPSADDPIKSKRIWVLDPIDGTKGFLRGRLEGGQYCIALALLEDGEPVVSVLGCPNLPGFLDPANRNVAFGTWPKEEIDESETRKGLFSSKRGCLFVAVRGCGCYELSIHDLEKALLGSNGRNDIAMCWKRLHVTSKLNSTKTPSQATFCLGVERGFSDPNGTVLKVAELLHGEDALITQDGISDIKNSFRMDGQGKYGVLARGEAEYFLRLPKAGYVDWVWDVAAGYLCLTEAGGKMTDVNGNRIDFSGIGAERKAKLPDGVQGLLGSCGGHFHDALVDAYKSIESL
ncbi:hypothetical protein ACHAWO_001507 [Cyclotella atomus]|uniref:3'(2'),5'-bisphosphate nucleotidase n=1 Tax=Cyclotella atomus TaxID=382360 RepID=A0ABD3QU67_9STRA